MILERIEIHNFKSYKGTHIIGPFDRFSCIIGPNGSGKSNVLDAISFVLNVPNSCLRVKNMKNLIEHSEKEAFVKISVMDKVFERVLIRQEPQSTSDGSLLLDNTLNQDITNNTTCKYFIDQVKVTQKQYNSELEKLNIFSKIKNFIIYQGDIIKSDVNLLNILENISGSANYIEEYEQLGERMAAMNRDLSIKYEKRKDILEMMKEMNEVKAKEQNFQNLITAKEDTQRKLYGLEIRKKREDLSAAKMTLTQLQKIKEDKQYDELISTVNKLRTEAAKLQKEYFEKETELSFIKSKQNKQSDFDLEAKTKEIENLRSKVAKIHEELMRLPEPFEISNRLRDKSVTKEQFENLLVEKEKEFVEKTKDLEKELSEVTLQNFDKINRRDQIQHDIKAMKLKEQKIIGRNNELELENINKQNKINLIDKEISILTNQIQDKVQSYDQLITDENNLNKEFDLVMKDILLNKAKKNDLTRKSMIKSVVENLKTIFTGVHGRVIDLIQPTQKKYELAVGVLLSKYDQAVVVDNEKTAMDCLRYIKETRSCKLTFLPLSRMKSTDLVFDETPENKMNTEIRKERNAIKSELIARYSEFLAKNCIIYDSSIEKVISFVFKNSLILDSDNLAKEIIYNNKYPGNVCTRLGTLYSTNGLITGGKSTTNKFEDSLIDGLISKRKSILNSLKVIKDRKEAFADVEAVKMKIEDLKNKKATIKFDKIENEILKDLNTSKLEIELSNLQIELSEFENIQKRIRESKKTIEKIVFGELMNTIGISSLSEYKERVKIDIKREELMISLDLLKDKIAILSEEIGKNSQINTNVFDLKQVSELESDLNRVYVLLEDVKEKLRLNNQNLKSYSIKRDDVNRSILNHQVHISRLEEDLKDLIRYAELEANYKDGYGLEELQITASLVSQQEINELKHHLEDLNRQISENIPTVTSTDSSIQARYSKANREYEIAKEALMTVKRRLLDIKKLRMEAFGKCFEVVASEIAEIYRSLTADDSGEANAYLVYEGDPFLNNLKYYLMPPSKKFIPFQELSGGERSIAILAFIFALGKYKKSPFFIFDEVDSALDKVNVERLSRYLCDSSDQFLVVSLKPQFFSKSESLFGIYKDPTTNTSKVLSLKLN